MSKGARGGKVKQDSESYGQGVFPATRATREDAMFLFKAYQRYGPDVYKTVLGGTRNEIADVENESAFNTPEFAAYDPRTYTGPLKAAVDAFVASRPRPTIKPHR